MTKKKLKVDAAVSSRERTVTWADDQKKYMLDWYIDYLKDQHVGFKFKKQHHLLCADALNKKFAMGVTVDQVDRQYRHYKENWKIIAAALSKSGNSFDHTRCIVTISESEKATLCDRARRLLTKPIKFYEEMQELFTGSSADGSLAMDQNTCMDVSDDSDSDSREMHDLNGYTPPEDPLGDDSDTIPTPITNATGENNYPSNYTRSGIKRSRGNPMCTLSTKKAAKYKSRLVESNDEITATMKSLRDTLVATAPPHISQLVDPHATLWQRLETIPLTPDQRIIVGEHLSSKENEVKRSWLCNASDGTLHAWVFKFLCDKEGLNL
ncbi:uncharacterized protein [Lolium perenne]|uniref:uncharacterized protein isoform X2 n=1 Tax=Lolium perenne TaxID=4522 RepID=UPI0021F6718F|nr:uncharacterized protein LOC127336616 isoform X3 [Lolium perenne]XP_051219409.1 uncharacterized protein LOC127336616 isoform X3 [Lolium perenne]XP_051219410.1 uncharacterized protein LOC127336616 isoform X3 [Lolium perenne]XP_051219411.1 uncharacterized protein LOC127336616 isoform X3 [Lolium perenne]